MYFGFHFRSGLLFLLGLSVTLLYSQPTVIPIPYSQSFSGNVIPTGWTQVHDEAISMDDWGISPTSIAGGTPNEMAANWDFGFGTSRLISPPLNTQGINSLLLNFRHFMSDYYFGTDFSIQSSSDGINWTSETWVIHSGTGNIGPEGVSTTVTHNLGEITYIAFVISGDHFQFWNWYIDDVSIDVLQTAPLCVNPLFPTVNAADIPTNTQIQWEPSAGATNYRLYVGTDNPPSNLINGALTTGATHYNLIGLLPSVQYYWKVIPSNGIGQPSDCPVWTFTTTNCFSLPLTEHFSGLELPFAWIEADSAILPGWRVFQGNFAGGSPNEVVFDFKPALGLSRLITPPMATAGQSILTLRFRTRFSDASPGMRIRIQSSQDATHWTDEGFVHYSGSGNIDPQEIRIPILNNLGGTTYLAFVLDGNLNSFVYWVVDDVSVVAGGFEGTLSGTVTYDKTTSPALSNVAIFLHRQVDGSIADSSQTDISGNYSFDSIIPGSYYLTYAFAHAWGGGNSVDALLTMKHFANITPLTGIRLAAADVNNSNNINSVDALLIMKRFVFLISSFVTGDWCFDTRNITIPLEGHIVRPIRAVCFGDVDASLNP